MEYGVYVSCPMTGQKTSKVFGLHRYIQERFDDISPPGHWLYTICPGRGEGLEPFETIPSDVGEEDQANPIRTDAGIVNRDFGDVERADAMICVVSGFDVFSKGVFAEISWWFALRKKRLVLVIEETGNKHDVMFVRGQTTYRTASLESGILAVATLVLPVAPLVKPATTRFALT